MILFTENWIHLLKISQEYVFHRTILTCTHEVQSIWYEVVLKIVKRLWVNWKVVKIVCMLRKIKCVCTHTH